MCIMCLDEERQSKKNITKHYTTIRGDKKETGSLIRLAPSLNRQVIRSLFGNESKKS